MSDEAPAIHIPVGKIVKAIVTRLPLVAAVAGIGAIGWGAWLIYPPAGFIAAGALMFVLAVVRVK